jgi:hypothetical protein
MDNREAIEAEIAALRQRRGAALASGKPFNDAPIVAALQKLDALADLKAEKSRIERQAATEAAEKELSKKRALLEALIGEDLLDIVEAEAGLRQWAAATSRRLTRNHQLRIVARDVGPVPLQLGLPEVERRIACCAAAVMGTISPNHKGRIQHLVFHPGVVKPTDNWRDIESKYLNQLLQKEPTT